MIFHDDRDRKRHLALLEDVLMEVARYFGRDAGVMSHGLRRLEERLAEEKELQRRVDRLRGAMREGRKGRIAKKQA
jgi:hypothetical protein